MANAAHTRKQRAAPMRRQAPAPAPSVEPQPRVEARTAPPPGSPVERWAEPALSDLIGENPDASKSAATIKSASSTQAAVQRAAAARDIGAAPSQARHTSSKAAALPDGLKSGVEALSGFPLGGVDVHYNSPEPARIGALAFTRGTDIHVAPGEERHLPHEAWHVVQQMQGRVAPTMQLKGVSINDSGALEREADVMGSRAARTLAAAGPARPATPVRDDVVQCVLTQQELDALKKKAGPAFANLTFKTLPNNKEVAIGPKVSYKLLRTVRGPRWHKIKKKKKGGKGFYGRLGDKPASMEEIAKERSYLKEEMDKPESQFTNINFAAAKSVGKRDQNNQVMGKYFLGKGDMPASTYALTPNCEWLHMRGHGLGGKETPDNLFAGTHAANSHMAAVETAIQEMYSTYKNALTVEARLSVNEDYHNQHYCTKIASELKLDPAWVYAQMKNVKSRLLTLVVYSVSVNGKLVMQEPVDPFEPGLFDEKQFDKLKKEALEAIKGTPSKMDFVSGGVL